MRRWLIVVGGVAALAALAPGLPGQWRRLTTGASLDLAVTALLSIALTAALAWLTVIALVSTVDSRLARRLGPGWLVAVAIGAAAVAPAHADSPGLSGLALPDRPVAARSVAADTGASSSGASGQVTVRPGDTLWAIASRASRSLPGGASDADIAAEVARWAAANRHVIGADPDLIVPGQQLNAPTGPRDEGAHP